jgi:hypothetical protein
MLLRSFERRDRVAWDARNFALVESLQAMTLRNEERVQTSNAFLPANGTLFEALESAGVFVVLRRHDKRQETSIWQGIWSSASCKRRIRLFVFIFISLLL